ncbi:MAG: sigma-70 family RNA polymerase sigma factor [Lachnospiraceae bacterium]|jgi:RNA polymerase sigma factor (sigma-70 family)|nr:sigma-70 family RNA polymerase sigma factor [Lachnospiraceae bacterium]
MAEREEFYIGLNNESILVSKEIYEVYRQGRRKESYFLSDLKKERIVVDKSTGQRAVIPGREVSYEQLVEAEVQFSNNEKALLDVVVDTVLLEKLRAILNNLPESEVTIIRALFWDEISEVELAKQLGLARTTLRSRKYKILAKLKKQL